MASKNFGSLKIDENNRTIMSGSGISTVDVSGTPKTSPLSYSSTTLTIAIPTNAAEMVLTPSTALRIGENSAMSRYYVIPASTTIAIPVADTDNIYIVRDSADGTLSFFFVTV